MMDDNGKTDGLAEPKQPDSTDTSGRNEKGRFVPGNKFSTGRKRQENFRKLFDRTISESDFVAVVQSLVNAAIGGDVQAIRLILVRCLGKEPEHIELTQKAKFHIYLPDDGRERQE
jgi:hypothetical protein